MAPASLPSAGIAAPISTSLTVAAAMAAEESRSILCGQPHGGKWIKRELDPDILADGSASPARAGLGPLEPAHAAPAGARGGGTGDKTEAGRVRGANPAAGPVAARGVVSLSRSAGD